MNPATMQPEIAPWRQHLSRHIERGASSTADWLMRHWLGILNWALGLIVLVAILTPVLAYLGIEPLAGQLFRSYHAICEQIPAHSFFLFGHQLAMCARNISLYGGMWLGTMIFRFAGRHVRPLKWHWLVLLLLPMALDGGTQLFGWRESNDLLRVVTGLLFGLGVCWFMLPFVQEAIEESSVVLPAQGRSQASTTARS